MADQNFSSSEEKRAQIDELVRRAAAGDENAFSALASHFEPTLKRMISPLMLPLADQGDLAQEGLIGLYKAVLLYDPKASSFSTFARICMNSAVIDGLRKYQKDHSGGELSAIPAEEIPAGESESPERILLGKEALSALLRKVDEALSPMEREVFGLSLRGKKVSEIASILGKTPKSIENTLFRLRKKLSGLS